MSTTYSHESGSQFPSSVISLSNFKDMDDTVKDIILQYYTFMNLGNINSAQALIEANATLLKPYWIDATILNKIEEELYNIGLFALSNRSTIISTTEPTIDCEVDTFWYQEV